MNSCGSVSMDRYWSYVATPLFYTAIGFGVFTLFVTQDVQIASTKDISKQVDSIRDAKEEMEKGGEDKPNPIDVTRSPSPKPKPTTTKGFQPRSFQTKPTGKPKPPPTPPPKPKPKPPTTPPPPVIRPPQQKMPQLAKVLDARLKLNPKP